MQFKHVCAGEPVLRVLRAHFAGEGSLNEVLQAYKGPTNAPGLADDAALRYQALQDTARYGADSINVYKADYMQFARLQVPHKPQVFCMHAVSSCQAFDEVLHASDAPRVTMNVGNLCLHPHVIAHLGLCGMQVTTRTQRSHLKWCFTRKRDACLRACCRGVGTPMVATRPSWRALLRRLAAQINLRACQDPSFAWSASPSSCCSLE